jgi:hypothetical protein
VDVVPESTSLAFARCATRLFNFLIDGVPQNLPLFESFVDRIVKLTASPAVYQGYFYRLLFTRVSVITPSFFLSLITRQSSVYLLAFECVARLAAQADLATVHLIVVHLSRCLSHRPVWTRLSGEILASIFAAERYDDTCTRWFLDSIRTSFVFVRLAS